MNKNISLTNQAGKAFHQLTSEIRNQFLGDVESDETLKEDLRVVLYSHDTMGIGHMRRNLLIANQIKRAFPRASVLAIAGAKEATTFSQNAGIDCLTLPSFAKKPDGTYTSRNLGISASDVLEIRSQTILAGVQSYQPDLFIVDKVPAGAGGELLKTLVWLSSSTACRCVLGLREILDSPEQVNADWGKTHAIPVIRKHFASIWIYGDPKVYDAVKEYRFPADISERVTYTGYLNTDSRLKNLSQLPYEIEVPFVLCTVGGGQDGEHLALNFVDAVKETNDNAVLLTGPYMPESGKLKLHSLAESVPNLKVVEFVDEGDLLVKHASHVISMGGYNTIAAILSHRKPALIVPRVTPRKEQLIRASRLASLGFVSCVQQDQLNPGRITRWLNQTKADKHSANSPLDMDGLANIQKLIQAEFPQILNAKK